MICLIQACLRRSKVTNWSSLHSTTLGLLVVETLQASSSSGTHSMSTLWKIYSTLIAQQTTKFSDYSNMG